MASVKNLKKDINYVLGDVIEECFVWELSNPDADTKKSQKIVDEAIASFDSLIEKLNNKKVDNKKTHYNSVKSDLELVTKKLLEKVNKL